MHLLFSFSLDEEIGGIKGMSEFVNMDDFKSLNVGFALDEGTVLLLIFKYNYLLSSEQDKVTVSYYNPC